MNKKMVPATLVERKRGRSRWLRRKQFWYFFPRLFWLAQAMMLPSVVFMGCYDLIIFVNIIIFIHVCLRRYWKGISRFFISVMLFEYILTWYLSSGVQLSTSTLLIGFIIILDTTTKIRDLFREMTYTLHTTLMLPKWHKYLMVHWPFTVFTIFLLIQMIDNPFADYKGLLVTLSPIWIFGSAFVLLVALNHFTRANHRRQNRISKIVRKAIHKIYVWHYHLAPYICLAVFIGFFYT
jgi:hypothetical protein